MNSPSREKNAVVHAIKSQDMIRSIRWLYWKLRMALSKAAIRLQDRFGWYTYTDWIRENEGQPMPTFPQELNTSLAVLVDASDPASLASTLDSLRSQTYPHWQAFVAALGAADMSALASRYQDEPRISWTPAVGDFPGQVLQDEFDGEWLGLLNSGDRLAPSAMTEFAAAAHTNPDASILYSDTDHLSSDGKTRQRPSFWPDWSPELLLSANFLRRALFRRADWVSHAAQALNLEDAILRCAQASRKMIHIPRVLCHLGDRQPDPFPAERFQPASLQSALSRQGLKDVGWHTHTGDDSPHFTWSYDQPLVSVIILTRDHASLLKRCLDSILSLTTYPRYEIILVENNSQEAETFAYYQQLQAVSRIKILTHNQPFNYSAFNNWAARQSQGELLLFLNNDIECLHPDWLDEMSRWSSMPGVGAVGARLLYPDHTIQHAGLIVGLEGHANHVFSGCPQDYHGLFGSVGWYRNYSAITGACMLLPRQAFEQVGGFDEGYSVAFNDVEICLRLVLAGWRVVYTPFARLLHHEGATRSTQKPAADIRLASRHLKSLIEGGDPYYNPNLSHMLRVPTFRRRGEMAPAAWVDLVTRYLG